MGRPRRYHWRYFRNWGASPPPSSRNPQFHFTSFRQPKIRALWVAMAPAAAMLRLAARPAAPRATVRGPRRTVQRMGGQNKVRRALRRRRGCHADWASGAPFAALRMHCAAARRPAGG